MSIKAIILANIPGILFLQSPTQNDSQGIFPSTVCTEFPPESGANVVNRQQYPDTGISEHPVPECCVVTAVLPCCPDNNSTCHQEQLQSQTDDGGNSVPSLEQNLEGSSEEGERSSETAKLVPQATNVPCGVIQRQLFDVSGSVNQAVCPIRPKLDVCMLVCSSHKNSVGLSSTTNP